MTILAAVQSAMIRLVGRKEPAVFSSQDPTMIELADLVNETAVDILKKHDWQALTKIATITGDGVASAFPLPADYDRMVLAQSVNNAQNWFWDYDLAPDLDTWIAIQDGQYLGVTPGWWIILGNKFQFAPVPPVGQVAKFPYVSNYIALSPTGVPKAAFSADLDTSVIDERLLTLGLIWRWRAQKSLEYTEAMQSYEIALSEAMARDRGSRAIRSSSRPMPGNVHVGWPWPLGDADA